MDANRLISMLTRIFIRSATDAGIDVATRSGKPVSEMTPEERQQARAAQETARRFKKTTRMVRRSFRKLRSGAFKGSAAISLKKSLHPVRNCFASFSPWPW
jgi:hypothetical protein